jgi:uncharacterized protein (DUF2236 family)
MASSGHPQARDGRHRERHQEPPPLHDALAGGIAVAIGGANVVMQLARLPVGRGVAESRVQSGRLDEHPLKRTRTTFTYLAVAAGGTDEERLALRREVDRAHRHVRSTPADDVHYDAFDPEAQLWVAACLYRGVALGYELLYGNPDGRTADSLYHECARFATTLQVPPSLWPPDRCAFEAYWERGVGAIEIDEITSEYLRRFARLGFLPLPLRLTLGPLQQFLTTGFLPEPFRRELGLPWGGGRQFAFELTTTAGAIVLRHLPSPVRRFPFNYLLSDFRRRRAEGRPVV